MDLTTVIKNEEEALLLLSNLGFLIKDWALINRLGGPLTLLSSGLLNPLIKENNLEFSKFRENFDKFLAADGFMISLLTSSSRLFKCAKSPLAYLGRFNRKLLDEKASVAIVGSRDASFLGKSVAKKLSAHIAKSCLVVSGGASGIDQAAHDGALEVSGKTLAISGVACNLLQLDRTAKLFSKQPEHAVMLYPYGPFIPQGKFMFVERNRFVAAAADAVVVVEGQVGSGTLHTASFAKLLNIPLFAIPQALDNPKGFAPNHLLERGDAMALVDFDYFLSRVAKTTKSVKSAKKVVQKELVKSPEVPLPMLLQVLKDHENSLGFDELLKITGKSFATLQKELFEFELLGQVAKRGAQFVLTAG